MNLYIDTSENKIIKLALIQDGQTVHKLEIPSEFSQAEKLLPAIEELMKKGDIGINDIKMIRVADTGEGFTSLRIGIVTANALGYALGIPVLSAKDRENAKNKNDFDVVSPKYDKEPNITEKKKKIVD
jgi:tRNA threonylcarbamoyladenosine biosynthesis protein TsaB